MSPSSLKLLAKILLSLAVFILSLLVAEAVARLAFPQWRPGGAERGEFWEYHAVLGWSHRPHATGRFTGPGWGADVRINGQGLRDVEHDFDQPTGHRILILGDSFGWGYGVEMEEGIAARLRESCSGYEFVNASVTGYGTDQEYLYYKREGHKYRAKTVLLLIYTNDIAESSCSSMYGYPKPQFVRSDGGLELRNVPVPPRSVSMITYEWLHSHSFVASQILLLTGWGEKINIGCDQFDVTVSQMLLTGFARELRSEGVEFRWVLIPEEPGKPSNSAFYGRIAGRERVPMLDLAPALAAEAEQGAVLTLPGNSHWNPAGHRVAARAVAEDLGCF